MYDWIIHASEAFFRYGLSPTAVVMSLFALLKMRAVKKRLRRYIPWLIDDDSPVREYVQNQREIMQNQKLMMERMGLEWSASTSQINSADSAPKKKRLSSLLSMVIYPALLVKRYITYWRSRNMKLNKNILIPLLSAIALFIKEAFGYTIPDEWIDMAANIVLYGVMFAGLFINHKKPAAKAEDDTSAEEQYH
ncbi:hypothetical protein BBD42_13180 [Paenibacillus sp. BIHB 4019]|uniref:Uncharacterized protein n=1 Tax=Paenibacillus sp. BIHB 4019 TaxID=1870819 RepID=A0A1B2DHZ7_9BACL|nr:hypothetical protein [Paenibacillus sp. BIHB 4019]ANY67321.1 hypothetical protein BBD42_13180 [Paenibacillus sp. BIHB 4019]